MDIWMVRRRRNGEHVELGMSLRHGYNDGRIVLDWNGCSIGSVEFDYRPETLGSHKLSRLVETNALLGLGFASVARL